MSQLRPTGSLRARFTGESDSMFRRLDVGARRCDLGDEGLYLAEEIVAADRWLGGSDPEALAVLVLALLIAQRQGSSRLPLDPSPKGRLRTLVAEILRVAKLETDPTRVVKRITNLTANPTFNSVIGIRDARLPLIVEDNCLYTERSRWLEQRVANRLSARLAATRPLDADVLTDLANRPGSRSLSAEQLRAVELALSGSLTVVTGGPGTGKTLVAAAIVRGFAHHAKSPLPIGALIVDEASMVDLELMDALLDALPAHVPLVLVGDAHQLPAIDAGQILADLAEPGSGARVGLLEHSFRMDAADPRGRAVFEAARAVHGGDAHKLTERTGQEAGPLGSVTRGKTALATPRTPGTLQWSGCEWVEPGVRPLDTAHAVAAALWHHFEGPRAHRIANDTVFRFENGRVAADQHAELEGLWSLLARARVLTATRGLPTGSLALNAYVHDLALDRMTVTGRPDFVPGEPVMITANDYQRGLFNGDQGIVVRADEGGGSHRFRAVFRVGGQLVPFAIEALRDRLELAWALTVHKSQGSELDALALILPDEDLPLLTRELLYTGITRARTSVVLCGTRTALTSAGKRVALRHSGLAKRLRAP